MKLVVGLGNPGERYRETRHNVGFMVADLIRDRGEQATSYQNRFDGLLAKTQVEDESVWLLKPQTYMNRSGRSVSQALSFYKLLPEDLVVIHDDLDLLFGDVRVKVGGGSGGHRGLESCFTELGTKDFNRVRCGIGRPENDDDATDHVLDQFADNQRAELPAVLRLAADAVKETVCRGAAAAMNRFNRRKGDRGGEP